MNKTKRNLMLWAAIITLVEVCLNLSMLALAYYNPDYLVSNKFLLFIFNCTIGAYEDGTLYIMMGIVPTILMNLAGLVGAILMFVVIRNKGKHFRRSRGMYLTSVILIIFSAGIIPWILLLIAMFTPDIVVMNTYDEVRSEERREQHEMDYKRQQIENLRKMKDEGIISEEEYKQRLMDLL